MEKVKDIKVLILKELNKSPHEKVNIAPAVCKVLKNPKINRPHIAEIIREMEMDKLISIPPMEIDKIIVSHAGRYNDNFIEATIKPKGIEWLRELKAHNLTRVIAIYGAVTATVGLLLQLVI